MLSRLLRLAGLTVVLPATVLAQEVSTVRSGLTPTLPDTVLTADVEEDNGRAVLRSTGEPVTGIVVEFYPSGAKRMRRSVVDGRAEGFWIEWYESGIPRYMARWANGRGEGVWTYFHENGEVRERAAVVGDVYTGPVEGWHANGQKSFEGYNLYNDRDGVWRFWNEDGTLNRTEEYNDGELVETHSHP